MRINEVAIIIGCIALFGLTACATTPIEDASPFDLVKQADTAYSRGDWSNAERHYRLLTEKVPQDAYAFFRLGNVFARQYRLDHAVQAYHEALKREPNLIKVYHNLATLRLLQAEEALAAGLTKTDERSLGHENIEAKLKAIQVITGGSIQEIPSPNKGLLGYLNNN